MRGAEWLLAEEALSGRCGLKARRTEDSLGFGAMVQIVWMRAEETDDLNFIGLFKADGDSY